MPSMRAIFQDHYGAPDQVLHLRDVEIPTPDRNEVLVRVRAASVHPDVWHAVTGYPRVLRLMGAGLRYPKQPIPGIDMAGEVQAVGSDVSGFAHGDAVFGETHRHIQWINGGAYAEYVCVPQDVLAHKPEGVTFEQAASVPTAGIIAINNLHEHLCSGPGQRVLINGAAGGVGSIAIQMAKRNGAFVIGIDHTSKQDFMRSLGADEVLDYRRDDVTQVKGRFDLVIDVASTLSLSNCKKVLQPNGKLVIIGHDHYGTLGQRTFGSLPKFFALMVRGFFDQQLPKPSFETMEKHDAMEILRDMLEAGELTPVVAKTFSLAEVPLAMACLQDGQLCGRIVIVP